MSDDEIDYANSEEPLKDIIFGKIIFGNILLLQTIPMLRTAGPRMLSVRFVTKASVDAVRLEQRHIS